MQLKIRVVKIVLNLISVVIKKWSIVIANYESLNGNLKIELKLFKCKLDKREFRLKIPIVKIRKPQTYFFFKLM
jgi:hypothetical protein